MDDQKQGTKGKQESFYPPQIISSLSDKRPAHTDSLLAFPPLFIFAESPPTRNPGEIPSTEDVVRHFAVGIMMDRGTEGSINITSVVWVVVTIVCLMLSHLALKVFRSGSSVVN